MPGNTSGGVPGLWVTGRYRLVASIGQGGMGRVWRAADEMLDRQVAVKEIRMAGLDMEDVRTRRERTLREARATARIDHPNVVRVYDVVDEGDRLWIVMELVDGRSLEGILVEDGPVGLRETARIGLELVAALRQVHAGGVLHRDIKPGNVLVERQGQRVVLTDFGIAAIQDAKALTMAGMLVGSPDYMAPERVSGRPQGPPSDLWSLGATLCAALGGQSPFSRSTTLATLHAVLYEEPELPSSAGELTEILAPLLEKEPSARPGLEEVAEALGRIVAADGGEPGKDTATLVLHDSAPTRAARQPPGRAGGAGAPSAETSAATGSEAARTSRPPTGPSGVLSLPAPPGTEGRTPTGPGPARPSGARRSRRRAALMGAAGLAAAGGVAGILIAAGGGPNGSAHGTSAAPPYPSVSSGTPGRAAPSSASPTVAGTSRPPSVPPGSRTEAGLYAWVPPRGWQRTAQSGAEVHYSAPDRTQEIVANATPAQGDLLQQWEQAEQERKKGLDYRRIRLEKSTFRGAPAVVWEYTVTAKARPWHVRLLGFRAHGTSYEISTWYDPDAEDRATGIYDEVQSGFTPL